MNHYLTRLGSGALLVLGSWAHAQEPRIRGIDITSNTFDPTTKVAKIVFTNISTKDITAYGVIYREERDNGSYMAAYGKDFLQTLVYYQIELTMKPTFHEPDHHPIHPGQSQEEVINLADHPGIVEVSAGIDVVIYSDGTAEYENSSTFDRLLRTRKAYLQALQDSIKAAKKALAATSDHPVAAAAQTLKQEAEAAKGSQDPGELGTVNPQELYMALDSIVRELTLPVSGDPLDTWYQMAKKSSKPPDEQALLRYFISEKQQEVNIVSQHTQARRVS